jgi:hypothetical protein
MEGIYMHPHAAWKIGVAVIWLSMLSWFPWDVKALPNWGGPVACLGQVTGEKEPDLGIIVGSFSDNSLISSSSIVGNTMIEKNGVSRVEILNSFRGFTGIAQVNQAAGYMNNQVNLMGITDVRKGGATLASVTSQSQVKNNTLTTSNNTYQTAITGGSFAGGTGVAMVNQAAGNMNSQLSAFNITIGAKRSLTDTQLNAVEANNSITKDPAAPNKHSATLDLEGGAFKNFTGLVSTSQVAGNMNQVSTVFNVNVTVLP